MLIRISTVASVSTSAAVLAIVSSAAVTVTLKEVVWLLVLSFTVTWVSPTLRAFTRRFLPSGLPFTMRSSTVILTLPAGLIVKERFILPLCSALRILFTSSSPFTRVSVCFSTESLSPGAILLSTVTAIAAFCPLASDTVRVVCPSAIAVIFTLFCSIAAVAIFLSALSTL